MRVINKDSLLSYFNVRAFKFISLWRFDIIMSQRNFPNSSPSMSMNEKLIRGFVRSIEAEQNDDSTKNGLDKLERHPYVAITDSKLKPRKKYPDKQLYQPPTRRTSDSKIDQVISSGSANSVTDEREKLWTINKNASCSQMNSATAENGSCLSSHVMASKTCYKSSHMPECENSFVPLKIEVKCGDGDMFKPASVFGKNRAENCINSARLSSNDDGGDKLIAPNHDDLKDSDDDSVFVENASAKKKRKATTSPEASAQRVSQSAKKAPFMTRIYEFFKDNNNQPEIVTNIATSDESSAYSLPKSIDQPLVRNNRSNSNICDRFELSGSINSFHKPVRFSMGSSKSSTFLPRSVAFQQMSQAKSTSATPISLKKWRSQPDIIASPDGTETSPSDPASMTAPTKTKSVVQLKFPPYSRIGHLYNNHVASLATENSVSDKKPENFVRDDEPENSVRDKMPENSVLDKKPQNLLYNKRPENYIHETQHYVDCDKSRKSLFTPKRASELSRAEQSRLAQQPAEIQRKFCDDKNIVLDLDANDPEIFSPLHNGEAKICSPNSNNSPYFNSATPQGHSSDWSRRLRERCRDYGVGYIDSHCHIDFLYSRLGFRGTFERYRQENSESFPDNYEGCVAVFCAPFTFKPHGGLWKGVAREEGVWLALGCHPKFATDYSDTVELNLRTCLQHPKVVAAGEFGLDYSAHFQQYEHVQKAVFIRQLKVAMEMKLPLVIHCREAEDDTFDIMVEHVPRDTLIHRHCFTGWFDEAQRWLDYFPNLFIGLTNVVSFPTARGVHDVARRVPLDRLLLETDAPYFKPRAIYRESIQYSNPGMAIFVAEEVARIRQISPVEVLRACRENTRKMYGV